MRPNQGPNWGHNQGPSWNAGPSRPGGNQGPSWNSPPSRPGGPSGASIAFKTLNVTCHSASGLPNTDTFGKADPYVIITVGSNKQQTPVMKDAGSNPVWEHSMEFKEYSSEPTMNIAVWDKDTLKRDDEMGEAEYNLAELVRSGARSKYTFKGDVVLTRNGKPSGQIRMTIQLADAVDPRTGRPIRI